MSNNFKSRVLFVTGALVLSAAAVDTVVAAALTSWWVLFALLALCPLMMGVCGAVMMTSMGSPFGDGFCGAGSCAPWRRGDVAAD